MQENIDGFQEFTGSKKEYDKGDFSLTKLEWDELRAQLRPQPNWTNMCSSSSPCTVANTRITGGGNMTIQLYLSGKAAGHFAKALHRKQWQHKGNELGWEWRLQVQELLGYQRATDTSIDFSSSQCKWWTKYFLNVLFLTCFRSQHYKEGRNPFLLPPVPKRVEPKCVGCLIKTIDQLYSNHFSSPPK